MRPLSSKNKRILIVLGLLALFFSAERRAFADTMSSTNYMIQADTMSMGGNRSTSTNFVVTDTLGDLGAGGGLSSTNFKACAGYQCFQATPYITFAVKQGTSSPGSVNASFVLGGLSPDSVKTSDGTSVNSIFITAESNASLGTIVRVKDSNVGLKRTSTSDIINSATATLVAGTPGYGLCVFSTTQDADSPTSFTKQLPYNSTCTKTTGHSVGALATSAQQILLSTGALKGGSAEILVKAATSFTMPAATDYADTLTFIATGTF